MNAPRPRSISSVDDELSILASLSRTDLVERWQKTYGCKPPKGIKANTLILSAAWHLQVKHLGGLKGEAKRQLSRLTKARYPNVSSGTSTKPSSALTKSASDIGDPPLIKSTPPLKAPVTVPIVRQKLLVGTRLAREWNGRMHVVEVIEGGFSHDGKTYRSLSAIAKKITNAHWSGPRFFGL